MLESVKKSDGPWSCHPWAMGVTAVVCALSPLVLFGKSATSPKAIVKAGIHRLSVNDERRARALFEKVTDDPVALKSSPDAVADAFDHLHLLLLKQEKGPAREKLIARCRRILPKHSVNARIAEREGDARLVAGEMERARMFYAFTDIGLSVAGSNAVMLLSVPKSNAPPLTQTDVDRLVAVAETKPLCGLALCELLAKRREGWRAVDIRARIYIRQKKFAEAVAVWEALLKGGKGALDVFALSIAETSGFMQGNPARAAILYEDWLNRYPRSSLREKAEYQRAGALWMAGEAARAVAAFDTFLAAYPASGYADEARSALDRARRDLANIRRTQKTSEDPLALNLVTAEERLREGNAVEAIRLFSRFKDRQSHPLWGRAWYGYGLCRRVLGDPEKALTAWEEILRRAATRTNVLCVAECRRARADVLLEDLADPDKALAAYRAAHAALLPERSDSGIERGIALALLALGRGQEARPIFEALRKKEDGDPIGVLRLNGLIARCNNPVPQPVAASSKERRIAIQLRVADVHFAAERWDKAARLYRDVARHMSGSETAAYADMQRARCIAHGDHPARALQVYDRFLKVHAHSAWADDALLRAGVLCTGPLGDVDRAKRYFREILRSHPDSDRAETAALYLATLAWWTGEWREAERLHRAFLAQYPKSPFREEILTQRLPAIAARKQEIRP